MEYGRGGPAALMNARSATGEFWAGLPAGTENSGASAATWGAARSKVKPEKRVAGLLRRPRCTL